jgi:hypothetical protein
MDVVTANRLEYSVRVVDLFFFSLSNFIACADIFYSKFVYMKKIGRALLTILLLFLGLIIYSCFLLCGSESRGKALYLRVREKKPSRNDTILEFAKLDYNIPQALYCEELKPLTKTS